MPQHKGPISKESVEVAAEFLKENKGEVPDYRVEQAVRSVGGKIGRKAVAEIRKSLGFPLFADMEPPMPQPVPGSKRVRVFGVQAVAARQADIGTPIRGAGSICQEIGEEYLGLVKVRASKLAAAAQAGQKKNSNTAIPVPVLPMKNGHKRKRMPSDLLRSLPMVRELLAASQGRMRNSEILRTLRAAGLGLNSGMVSEVRKEMGFKKPYKTDPRAPGMAPSPVPSAEPAPEATHPLVVLISNLAANFGLTYLHWEKGGEVVFREEQERRFKL